MGVGSMFVMLIYMKWVVDYQQFGGLKVNYQGIGLLGGLKQIVVKMVDFVGLDVLLKDEEFVKEGLFQFLMVVGGVVLVVNVLGVKVGELMLLGLVFGDIYFGKIKKWNDLVIVVLNLKVKLLDMDIVVVCCVDGLGMSFIWMNYLLKVSDEWKLKIGEGMMVNWLMGMGGKGNDGVVVFVQCLLGVIGYVEWVYVKKNNMIYMVLKNLMGMVVELKMEMFKVVVVGVNWLKLFYQILMNQLGKEVWLVVGVMFVLLYVKQDKLEQGVEMLKFFSWVFKNGEKVVDSFDYILLLVMVEMEICKQWKMKVMDVLGKLVVVE